MKSFSVATIEDIHDYNKSLLKKEPKNVILHIWTNNTVNDTSRTVLDKLLSFVEKPLPDCNVCISELILRTDNAKASLTVNNFNQHFSTLQLRIIDNGNIKGAYIKYVGGGRGGGGQRRRVLQIFEKIFRSPGDHRSKYFMAH